jgi:hypothetical protein
LTLARDRRAFKRQSFNVKREEEEEEDITSKDKKNAPWDMLKVCCGR